MEPSEEFPGVLLDRGPEAERVGPVVVAHPVLDHACDLVSIDRFAVFDEHAHLGITVERKHIVDVVQCELTKQHPLGLEKHSHREGLHEHRLPRPQPVDAQAAIAAGYFDLAAALPPLRPAAWCWAWVPPWQHDRWAVALLVDDELDAVRPDGSPDREVAGHLDQLGDHEDDERHEEQRDRDRRKAIVRAAPFTLLIDALWYLVHLR